MIHLKPTGWIVSTSKLIADTAERPGCSGNAATGQRSALIGYHDGGYYAGMLTALLQLYLQETASTIAPVTATGIASVKTTTFTETLTKLP